MDLSWNKIQISNRKRLLNTFQNNQVLRNLGLTGNGNGHSAIVGFAVQIQNDRVAFIHIVFRTGNDLELH